MPRSVIAVANLKLLTSWLRNKQLLVTIRLWLRALFFAPLTLCAAWRKVELKRWKIKLKTFTVFSYASVTFGRKRFPRDANARITPSAFPWKINVRTWHERRHKTGSIGDASTQIKYCHDPHTCSRLEKRDQLKRRAHTSSMAPSTLALANSNIAFPTSCLNLHC